MSYRRIDTFEQERNWLKTKIQIVRSNFSGSSEIRGTVRTKSPTFLAGDIFVESESGEFRRGNGNFYAPPAWNARRDRGVGGGRSPSVASRKFLANVHYDGFSTIFRPLGCPLRRVIQLRKTNFRANNKSYIDCGFLRDLGFLSS